MVHDMETGEIPMTTGPVPVHVAIIMDGNGRWAEARGEARHAGHRAGVASVGSTIEECLDRASAYSPCLHSAARTGGVRSRKSIC